VRDTATAEGGPAGHVSHDQGVAGAGDGGVVQRDTLHQLDRVHILHEAGVDQIMEGETGDGDNGRAVHLGVVKSVQQMDCTRAGGGDAGAEPPGVLGIAAGHEDGCLLVPHADIADLVLSHADGLDQGPDSVADHPENDRHLPGDERLHDDIGRRPVSGDAGRVRLPLHASGDFGRLGRSRAGPERPAGDDTQPSRAGRPKEVAAGLRGGRLACRIGGIRH